MCYHFVDNWSEQEVLRWRSGLIDNGKDVINKEVCILKIGPLCDAASVHLYWQKPLNGTFVHIVASIMNAGA